VERRRRKEEEGKSNLPWGDDVVIIKK